MIMPAVEWVKITDTEMLRKVGCPWKATTLRTEKFKKKHPGLLSKPVGTKHLVLHVPTLHKILEGGRSQEG